jgi:hypothetical protein
MVMHVRRRLPPAAQDIIRPIDSEDIEEEDTFSTVNLCAQEPASTPYGLDNGVAVSEKLAAELTGADRLQSDLFLKPNEAA